MKRITGKLALVALDIVLLSAAYASAFYLRLGSEGALRYVDGIVATLPIVLAVSLPIHMRLGLFNAILRYASLDTLLTVLKSVALSVSISCLLIFLFRISDMPVSVFVIYAMEALLLIGGSRVVVRLFRQKTRPPGESRAILLYGATDTAELVLRGLRVSHDLPFAVVGLLDDDPSKRGSRILGAQILGGLESLADVVRGAGVDELWVCIPNVPGAELRLIYDAASSASVPIKILPRLEHAFLGAALDRFHEPKIADLLRRPPRNLDRERMQSWVRRRRILVTGAGGSIGSELALQVARLNPSSLALCDSSEANLFTIHEKLKRLNGAILTHPYLIDVRNCEPVRRMFREVRPDIVFHAAAYKHVPLVELNPCEGVSTNVQGLWEVASAAVVSGVEDFVFISSDKAVRPASVMGATKRLGETMTKLLSEPGTTRFTAVRFGNVLGSSGSVVPIFQEQIRRGGPVTVTHPEMTRYFMLVSEAVELVIQAGSIGKGGEVFILDMGNPVGIADLAKDLIRLMGKREVRIEFTGPRPGEKIREELMISPGDYRTSFQDIWIDGDSEATLDRTELEAHLSRLFAAARDGQTGETVRLLQELVPSFQPSYRDTRKRVQTRLQEAGPARLQTGVERGVSVTEATPQLLN